MNPTDFFKFLLPAQIRHRFRPWHRIYPVAGRGVRAAGHSPGIGAGPYAPEPGKPVRWLSGAYIAVFRSTPMLVQLSIIYYGLFYAISLPRLTLFGFVDISRFVPGVVALALNSSAYVAEIFPRRRPGRWTRQQAEAARSLGLSQLAEPCAWRCCRRPCRTSLHCANQLVTMVKESFHLLRAGHGGDHVRRQDHRRLHRHLAGPLHPGGAGTFLASTDPGLQGH